MWAEFRADVRRFHRAPTPPSRLEAARLIVDHFGLQALLIYRGTRAVYERAQRGSNAWRVIMPVAHALARGAARLYGIYLDPKAVIGPGLYIGHSGGIHVSSCTIGAGSSIHQRVRIAPSAGGTAGPIIGERVWIGCHARIEGPIRIGERATLGAGAVVTRDVPDRSLVVGAPGRVIQRDYDNAAIL